MHTDTIETTPEAHPAPDRQLELLVVHDGEQLPFTFTEKGIIIPEDLSYEGWKRGLGLFEWASKRLKQDFPKYLAFGELKFGREATLEWVQQLEFDLPMVSEALKINNLPEAIRQFNLSAGQLIALARSGLSASEQTTWAQKAIEEDLSPTRLKQSIAEGSVVTDESSQQQSHGFYSAHGIRGEFDIWWGKRINGMEGIKKMPIESAIAIADELSGIADAYDDIMEYLTGLKRASKKKPR